MAACCKYLHPTVATKLFQVRTAAPTTQILRCFRLNLLNTFSTKATQSAVISQQALALKSCLVLPPSPKMLQPSQISWCIYRTYAKKGKNKGGKGPKKMTLTAEELDGLVDMERVGQECDKILEDLREKFIHQLTVRTSQGVFDSLSVKTPDGNFPLIQLGQVIQKSPQLLTINMAASPQYIPQVKQALSDSGLNVNPQQDGTSLFIPLPKVTREHRENLAKNAKMVSEQSKKSLRDIYSKYARKIKASKEGHSADDLAAADEMVKDLMHSMIHQVEEMTSAKQKELLGGK